jgi:hypothetical protein
MRFKVVVVDLEVSPRVRRWAKWVGIPLAILLGGTALVRAADPHMWSANDVLTATDLNASFKAVTDRVAALEGAKASVKVVMDNSPGPLTTTGKTAMFTSSGGQLLVMVSGSAFDNAGGLLEVAVQLDGNTIGQLAESTNEGGSHRAFPARTFSAMPAAGTHTIGLIGSASTETDTADFFNVTVVETR